MQNLFFFSPYSPLRPKTPKYPKTGECVAELSCWSNPRNLSLLYRSNSPLHFSFVWLLRRKVNCFSLTQSEDIHFFLRFIRFDILKFACYSTLSGKTDKLDEAVNRELNVTRSWNFIQIVDLAWFIRWMSFKLICIFFDFKAPLLENR